MDDNTSQRSLVFVIDDDADFSDLIGLRLRGAGHQVEAFNQAPAALAALDRFIPDAVCLDLHMPEMDGLEALERIRTKLPSLPVVMLTSDGDVESIVAAMQRGAYDYSIKNAPKDRLLTLIANAVRQYQMSVRLSQLEREVAGRGYAGIVGNSTALKDVFRQMDRLVRSDVTVLICGESGTGKELIANAIHDNGGRASGPFVALNCAAIPESLQESEMFGHEKGSFTGATSRRIGKFEMANGGTLFMDEVAELSLSLQAKLLRAIQERKFQRVGGEREMSSDFRLLAASHRDLRAEVEAGRFREDLYFRIAVFDLELPPLRQRGDDVLLLAQRFLNDASKRSGFNVGSSGGEMRLGAAASHILMNYHWPGNIRELQNAMERAIVLADGIVLQPEQLPKAVRLGAAGRTPLGPEPSAEPPERIFEDEVPSGSISGAVAFPDGSILTLEALEERAITAALGRVHGGISEVARRLGVSRATLYRKLKKYNLAH